MFDVTAEGRPAWRAAVEQLCALQLLHDERCAEHDAQVIDITTSTTEPKKESQSC